MARLLTKIIKNTLTGAMLALLVFQPLIASAQTTSTAQQYQNCLSNNAGDTTFCTQAVNNQIVDSSGNTIGTSPTTPAAGTTPAPVTPAAGGTNCSIFSAAGLALCISNVVYVFTVGIGSGFAYVSAYFFDFAVSLSLNSAAYALTFVSTGWTTARDIANMAFLFILIYIAFIIMLEADTVGTKDMLAIVIVMALLVNFSFFFTRLVIDAGNILSIQFYNAIQASPISTTSGLAGAASTVTSYLGQSGNTKDLTGSIMGMLNLQGLFNNTSFQAFTNGQTGASGFLSTLIASSFLYIAAGIMLWLLTIAFFTNGIKFLFRIVVLWFLIIASPLAFAARAIPRFRGYYDKWQSLLVSHAFYPAFFMFIFLILTNFAQQLGSGCTTAATNCSSNLINGIFGGIPASSGASFMAVIGIAIANVGIRLGFVVIVLYIGLEASKQISIMGASIAEKGGNWLGGQMAGLPAWGLRNTAGRGFNALSQSPRLNAAAEQKGVWGTLWRGTSRVTRGLGNATYDMRGIRPVAGLATGAGLGLGTPAKEGFSAQAKVASEKHDKESKERKAIIRDAANKEALKNIDRDIKAGRPHNPADLDRVKNLGKPELAKMSGDEIKNIAHLLSESQHKNVQEDEDRPFEEKQTIKKIAEPIIKAQKIVVDDLRKLNDSLTLNTSRSTVVGTNTAKNSVVNLGSIINMRTDLQSKMTGLRASLTAATPPGEAEDMKSDQNQLRIALKNLRELQKNVGNIQPHANRGVQEFTTY